MFGMLTAVPQPTSGHAAIYRTYEELFTDLNARMANDGYKVVKARSHRSKIGGSDIPGNDMVRCDLVCDRGGRPYKCLATKHKTSTKKTDCPWKAKAVNRKMMGGWVLTVICDQHNHEPGTPEPPSPAASEHDADGELEGNDGEHHQPQQQEHQQQDADMSSSAGRQRGGEGRRGRGRTSEQANMVAALRASPATPTTASASATAAAAAAVPALDPETQAAMSVAGVSQAVLKLTGETFHNFKSEYRKMPKPDRLQILAQFQLRIAAIYALENEDMQRQVRAEQRERNHRQVEENKMRALAEKRRRPAAEVMAAQAAAAQAQVSGQGQGQAQGQAAASPSRRRTTQQGTPQGTPQLQNQQLEQHHQQQQQQQQLQQNQMQTPQPILQSTQQQPPQQQQVDPNSFLHLDQFQVQVPQGAVASPAVGQFHHYTGPRNRLRGSRQAQS